MDTNDIGLTLDSEAFPAKVIDETALPIDTLGSDKALHDKILRHLLDRVELSERKMVDLHKRWQVNEKKFLAYIDLPDFEKLLKEMNDTGVPPKAVNITVPYTFATCMTVTTYLTQAFCGRSPIFQVSANSPEAVDSAPIMETVLQYQLERNRFVMKFHQFILDGLIYGVSVMRCQWRKEEATRTVVRDVSKNILGITIPGTAKPTRSRERVVTYEGNDVDNIDPYMFLPDPRVPMCEVNRRGEFVFWRSYEGKHTLLKDQQAGRIKFLERVKGKSATSYYASNDGAGNSARSFTSSGDSSPGSAAYTDSGKGTDMYNVIQGTVEIVPAELGLGSSKEPQKWLFMILNREQIVQAEPIQLDHDMHPVVVAEPYSIGYGFAQAGLVDYIAPIQDTLSWFLNSHIDNVRSVLNNMLVVDPSRIEMADLKRPGPGKLIRLKQSAYGTDTNAAIKQLQVGDVTQGHVRDFELVMRLGDGLAAVNDNMRGLQDGGGRKTATEIRTSAEAGASRLNALARLISAQAMVDLAKQMSLNTQQYISQEFLAVVAGAEASITIAPEQLVGDFTYPIHDGTLPIDRVAMVDIWKEIFMGINSSPELSQTFNSREIFKYIATLAGAKNIGKFEIKVAPDQPALPPQDPAAAPADLSVASALGPAAGLEANPGARAMQGMQL